jgi:hypothetical protein
MVDRRLLEEVEEDKEHVNAGTFGGKRVKFEFKKSQKNI